MLCFGTICNWFYLVGIDRLQYSIYVENKLGFYYMFKMLLLLVNIPIIDS